jgi:hypothetical protein
MSGQVVSLKRARVRRARHVVLVRKLQRIASELLLIHMKLSAEATQTDLDNAVAELRSVRGRKA